MVLVVKVLTAMVVYLMMVDVVVEEVPEMVAAQVDIMDYHLIRILLLDGLHTVIVVEIVKETLTTLVVAAVVLEVLVAILLDHRIMELLVMVEQVKITQLNLVQV